MVKKIVKRKPQKSDPFTIAVSDPIEDEDTGATYWSVVGTEYYVGFDEELKWFVYDPDSETGWDHLPGWAWYSDRKTLLRDFARFLGNEAPLPKFESKKDKAPRDKTHVLVALDKAPYHPRFPVINADLGLPETTTFYRLTKDLRFDCMVSVDVDGLHLAWDQCGGCAARVTRCRCPQGSTPPRAIVWCCTGAATNWEGTPTYQQSVTSRGVAPTSTKRGSTRAAEPRTTPTPAPAPSKSSKPAQPATGIVADLDSGNFDLGAVTKAAEEAAASAVKKTRKVIRRKSK